MNFYLLTLMLVKVALTILSCGVVNNHPQDLTPLPTHNYSRTTNHGFDDVVFRMVLEDGCLRGQGYESKNFPVPDSVLLVWPSGYGASTDEDTHQVRSTAGEVVAYPGTEVRFSGIFLSKDSVLDIGQDIAESQNCAGPYFLVGDEVSILGQDEPLILSVPEISLRFQRQESWRWIGGREMTPRSSVNGQVVLKDGCLLMSRPSNQGAVESEIIWPAGFYPHLGEDGLEVRSGGGKTIVRPGGHIVVIGNSRARRAPYTDDGCSEEAWKIRRIEDDGTPVELLRHDRKRTLEEVVWDGTDYNRRVWDDAFAASHIMGYVKRSNGCMKISDQILVWPANFTLDKSSEGFLVLDEDGNVVVREGDIVSLRIRIVTFGEAKGLLIVQNIPVGCDGTRFIFVGG